MPEVNLESLQKQVADLQAILVGKTQDVLTQDSLDKAIADVIAKLHPPVKKMVFGKVDTEDKDQKTISLGTYLKMVRNNDTRLKTVMSEADNAQGGYVVPPEYYNDIVYNVPSGAVAYPDCDDIPMGGNVLNISRKLTDLTIYWVEEDATKTLTKPTLERPTLTLKKMACIVPFTDELLEDNNVGLASKIAQWVNDAIAAEKDRLVLVGNTGAGDVAMGVGYAVGVNATAQAGANLAYDDLVDTMISVPEAYQGNAKWYLSLAQLGLIMKLKDLNNQPLFSLPSTGMTATILGKPYKLSGQIGATGLIIYGDLKQGVWLGHRSANAGLTVTVSNCAVAPATGALTQNAYLQDETWYRFVLRHGQTVIRPSILAKLTGVK